VADARLLRRLAGYACCGAALAYCSAAPSYTQLPPDAALVRLSMTIAGTRLQACRPLSAAELERLPPNMRHAEQCPRERSPVRVRLLVDGAPLVDEVLYPRGLARDGAATIYRRIVVRAGRHRIQASVNEDVRQDAFQHVAAVSAELAPGRVMTVDFDREAGGVLFR